MPENTPSSSHDVVLEAKGITKKFPGVLAKDNVEFDLRKGEFHALLGIESGDESTEAKRWRAAAAERLDKARVTGAHGVDGLKRFGGEARDQAGSMGQKLTERLADRKRARRNDDE